jgi:broad specificity phosphatase PhoE
MQADLQSIFPPSFSVLLARHATPDRSQYELPYYLPPGPPLSERGIAEAAELGQFLVARGVAHLFVSPLERTTTTAKIVADIVLANVQFDEDIAEMRPEESWDDVLERSRRTFLRAAHASFVYDSTVALVTHGSPVLALLRWLGLPEPVLERSRIYDSRCLVPPAGAWQVTWDGTTPRTTLVFVPSGVRFPEMVEIVG